MRLYSVNGREVWLLSVHELAKIVGVSAQTLRKWEKKLLLPKASILVPTKSKLPTINGDIYKRLYSEEQAEVLAWWVAKVQPSKGFVVKETLVNILHEKWDEATEKLKERLK